MRVADKMAFDQVNSNIAKNRSEMASLQNQAATQKRVTKPSDDPVAASRVLFSKTEQKSGEQFIKNLNYARSFLDFTDQSLNELTEVLMRAKDLALSQSSDGSSNDQTKRAVAAEISQLYDQAVQIGNRKLGERFIFGGYKTTTKPFTQDGKYQGDGGEMRIHIDKENFLAMNMPGSVIFHGDGLSSKGQTFKSEMQAMDVEELNAQRQKKGKETVETPENMKTAEEIKAQSQENQGENSEAQNDVRGPASLRTPSGVTHRQKNETENSDEPIAATPEELKRQEEGVNIFSVLKRLETSLLAGDKLGVQESLDRIDESMQQVILTRTSLGSRVTTIDQTLNSFYANGVETKATISQLEDADVFQTISDINKTESALQATLQTSGKMIQKSLMDFIS